ncbi:hypothetical protein [Gordonia crocea]|uniref:Uncharacterized protein n=1 Tax=Gordonia crocea TaxID=589162 RepID=A0A7I9UZ65_9ACTN|nr:hypothetical protein [Gordonia crocea]GED98209.1 hypothetical protein nbrc107697_22480 [Gordonia crocea]
MKALLYLVLGLVFGIFLVVIGVGETSKTTPTCGGRTMSQGDHCVSSKGGRKDFDQQLSSDRRGGYFMIGFGALVILGAAGVAVASLATSDKKPAPGNLTPQARSGPPYGQPLPGQPGQPFPGQPTPGPFGAQPPGVQPFGATAQQPATPPPSANPSPFAPPQTSPPPPGPTSPYTKGQ